MVAIQQYENKVGVSHTPTGYYTTKATPDAFGENIAQASVKLGENVSNFSNNMLQIKQQIDETNAAALGNYIDQLTNQKINDPKEGYLAKQGFDAMTDSNDPTKGSQAVVKDLEQSIRDKQNKLGLNYGYGSQMAELIITRKMGSIYKVAGQHELEQTKFYSTQTYNETQNLALQRGVNGRNNTEEINSALGNLRAGVIKSAQLGNWDQDTTRIQMAKAESQFYGGILQAYLQENSLKATEFYNQHKNQLLPDEQARYYGAVKDNENRYIARDVSDRLFNLYPEDEEKAFAEVDKIQNEGERSAIESRLIAKYNRKEKLENDRQDNLLDDMYNSIADKIKNGEIPSSDDIPQGLNGKNYIGAKKYIDDMTKKGAVDTDNSIYMDLYEMSNGDAQKFAKMNLSQYRPYLSDSDYKSFQKRQSDIKNMTPTQLADQDAQIQLGLKALGYSYDKKGTLKTSVVGEHTVKKAAAYRNTFNAYLKETEKKRGKNLSREEIGQLQREFTQSYDYKNSSDLYQQGMNKQVGFMRNLLNDFQAEEKAKGRALTTEEKNKIVAERVSKTVQQDNSDMSRSYHSSSSSPKIGDVWQGHKITSTYGHRTSPTKGASSEHKGVDLSYQYNERFSAFASGKVVAVGRDNGLGNYVKIRSADGTTHIYGHANSISVKTGQYVHAGNTIGRAGSTGISTGTHLHYAQLKNGNYVNPLHNSQNEKVAVNHTYSEGTVIRNPKNGQRMILKGGKWQVI